VQKQGSICLLCTHTRVYGVSHASVLTAWFLGSPSAAPLYICMRTAKESRPQTAQWLMPDCKSRFSLPKGGPNPDLHPRPPDLGWGPQYYCNTPGKLMAPGRSFWKSISGWDFHPAHLGTHLHKLSVQGCCNMSN
jgi:hypothetical protein